MDKSDAVIYESLVGADRGGKITTEKTMNDNLDNFFKSVDLPEALTGSIKYWCGYFKNDNPTENMDNVSLFIDPNSEHPDDKIEIGLEPATNPNYKYAPWEEFNGTTDYVSVPDSAALDLNNITISVWFRTAKDYIPGGIRGFLVNKGDVISSETAGTNLNYGLWIDSTNVLTGGYETATGADRLLSSPLTYNDDKWHLAVLTWDGANLKLYVDGVTTPVATSVATTAVDTNSFPMVIGRNSAAKNRYFQGQIDEVMIYNRAITDIEMADYYNNSNVPTGSVYSNNFSGPSNYKYAPYFEATGSTFDSTADNPDLRLVSFTIVAWFRTIMTTYGEIVGKGDDVAAIPGTDGTHINYVLYHTSAGKIGVFFEDKDGVACPTCESASGYNDGQWHLAVATYDRIEETLKIYIDGDLVKTTNDVTVSPDSGNPGVDPVVIGRQSHNSWSFFDGQIDEVRLYNHHTWSDNDVNVYYDTGVLPITDSLVFEKDFGEVVEPVPHYDTITAQTISSSITAPLGVTFTQAPTDSQGLSLGKVGSKQGIPFWLKRTLGSTREELKHNTFTLVIAFDGPVIVPGTTPEPGTGSGSGTGEGTPVPTPSPAASDVDIAVTGDWGTSSGTKATIDNILNFSGVKHTISVGDTSYESSANNWKDMTAALRASGKKMYFTCGNHDTSSSLISAYKTIFGFTSTFDSYVIGNLLLITGDMYKSFDSGSSQYNFIKSELEKAKNNSAILWRVVAHHEPLYGSPSKHPNNAKWRDTYHSLYDANGVDLDLNGHNHHYERTFPLKFNSGSPSSPTAVFKSDEPNYTDPKATIFITCGLGGHDIQYKFSGSMKSWSAAADDTFFGFLMLSVSNNGKTLTGKCYKNSGHSLFESFSIKKV